MTMSDTNVQKNNKTCSGYSLLELLIAMAVGIFVIGSTLSFFTMSKKINRSQHETSLLRENADFALTEIVEDIQLAGYFGCATRSDESTFINVLNEADDFEWDFSRVIHGSEYGFDEDTDAIAWTPALDASLTNPVRGDIITLRYADRREYDVVSHDSADAGMIRTTAGNSLKQYDFILATDCETSSIFQKTSGNYTQRVDHATGVGTPGNASTDLGRTYTSENGRLMKLNSVTYYIRNNVNDNPALYQKVNSGNVREVIEGIEDLQFVYGVDTDGDNSVNQYDTADTVDANNNWDNVLAVRVELLARSINSGVTPQNQPQSYFFNGQEFNPNDTYQRLSVSADVSLRNRVP
jgi:type IV pilus assembly protein PilW